MDYDNSWYVIDARKLLNTEIPHFNHQIKEREK